MTPCRGTASAVRLAAPRGGLRRTPHHFLTPIPRAEESPDPLVGAVYEPEDLALADPEHARAQIAALSPRQRVRQATAHAAWLGAFGYAVTAEEILAAWEHDDAPADDRAS